MAYQFNGIERDDFSGAAVSNAGDVTGDGVDDLIIGAISADPNSDAGAGQSYLVSGADLVALDNATANGGTAGDGFIELADVAAIGTSYQFDGSGPTAQSGRSLSAVGDVTGDGVDDLIIGAPFADPNGDTDAGASYLISGADLAALDNATANGGIAGDGIIELANIAGIGASYEFIGSDESDQSGISVSGTGDVTGDGTNDLLIGAPGADPGGQSSAGEAYLISGADLAALDNATANGGTAGDGVIELANVAAIGTSYQFNGVSDVDLSANAVSGAGDVTGDGVEDLIIGAERGDPIGDPDAGEAYLISGADLVALDNATANGGTAGDGIIELADVAAIGTSYQFNGDLDGDLAGAAVSAAGDVTGDGVDDLIIGAIFADAPAGTNAGKTYLISGADLVALDNATGNGGTAGDGIIELADAAAIGTSYQFNGVNEFEQSSLSVSGVGDVTGDGVDDLMIGAPLSDPSTGTNAGRAYLVSGADLAALDNATANGGTAGDGIIELANLPAIGSSYIFIGFDPGDQAGGQVSAAGDVTGDGVDDLLIGAVLGDPNGVTEAGESYLISGADLALYDGADGNTDGIIDLASVAPICFLAGTGIATPAGEVPVETLRIGDLVTTAGGAPVPVKWIGIRTIYPRFGHDPRLEPVIISRGALGQGLPTRDLYVSADHGMILDGLVINAAALVNGTSIRFVPAAALPVAITYCHIETEAHDVVLANGAAAETFADVVSRRGFDNHQEYLDLYGAERVIPEMKAPRITSARLVPTDVSDRLQPRGNRAGSHAERVA
ncbi:MAG: Hint domain-containing protein [Pseudomonadota bacterium]